LGGANIKSDATKEHNTERKINGRATIKRGEIHPKVLRG